MAGLIETILEFAWSRLDRVEIKGALTDALAFIIQDAGADKGCIELYDHTGEYTFQVDNQREEGCDFTANPVIKKIASHVKNTNRPFISNNLRENKGESALLCSSSAVTDDHLYSILCVPIRDEEGTFGVLYIGNSKLAGFFDSELGEKLQRLAALMAKPLRTFLLRVRDKEQTGFELSQQSNTMQDYSEIIGESEGIRKIKRLIDVLKDFDEEYNVLVTGETGTGKELVARMLHERSKRAGMPFVKYDCSTRSRDLLESDLFGHEKGAFTGAVNRTPGHIGQAEGGTLFLDEVGNLSPEVQVKLLHFLHNKTYTPIGMTTERKANVWLIMATNKDLKKLKNEGLLMEDIYYRLAKSRQIQLPPLRKRPEDISLLATFILKRFNKRHNSRYLFGEGFLDCLQRHHYPGNFRHLDKYVNDALFNAFMADHDQILPEHLPAEFFEDLEKDSSVEGLKPVREEPYVFDVSTNSDSNPFITGLQTTPRDVAVDYGDRSFRLHDHLLVAVDKAADMPLLQANEFVMRAFERNFILAARERHKQHKDVIAELGIDKSTYIQKLKRHGFRDS